MNSFSKIQIFPPKGETPNDEWIAVTMRIQLKQKQEASRFFRVVVKLPARLPNLLLLIYTYRNPAV